MFKWMTYWIWWFSWRTVITLACVFTIRNVIHMEQGILVRTGPLLIGTILVIVLIRMWSSTKETK